MKRMSGGLPLAMGLCILACSGGQNMDANPVSGPVGPQVATGPGGMDLQPMAGGPTVDGPTGPVTPPSPGPGPEAGPAPLPSPDPGPISGPTPAAGLDAAMAPGPGPGPDAGMVGPKPVGAGCTSAPAGMLRTETITGTSPDGNYTIVRPANLGEGGCLHPPVAWGNGLATVPSMYAELLDDVAANGFVVIGNPGTGSNPQVVRQGLERLIAQNDAGEYAGKLAVDCAGTIGYSMGGGAAVGSGAHPAVKAIVSMHTLQLGPKNQSRWRSSP